MSKIRRSPEPPAARRRVSASPGPPPLPTTETETDKATDYPVGYGRPPVETRFRPGASGNPKGRPKGATGLHTIVRAMMGERVPVRTAAGTTKMRRIEALLHKVFELALKGNARAQAQLLNLYAEAVPEVPIDNSHDGEEVDEKVAMIQELTIAFLKRSVSEN